MSIYAVTALKKIIMGGRKSCKNELESSDIHVITEVEAKFLGCTEEGCSVCSRSAWGNQELPEGVTWKMKMTDA